jgi:hypothetical protein
MADPLGAGFIFGGDTGLSYEELKRRRAIAAALASRQRGFPKNIGEGLTYLGESIGEAVGDWRLRAMEQAQKAKEAGILTGAPGSGYIPPVETGPPPARPSVAPIRPPPPTSTPVETPPPPPVSDGGGGPSVFPDPAPAPVSAAPVDIPVDTAAAFAPTSEPPPAQTLAFNVPTGVQPGPPPQPDLNQRTAYTQDQAMTALNAPLSPVQPAPELAQQPQGAPPGPQGPLGPPPPPMTLPTAAVNPPVDPRAPVPGPMVMPRPRPPMPDPQQTAAVAPQAASQAPQATGERRTLSPQGWAARDPRWQALSDDQRAAAMAIMEADTGKNAAVDRRNVLAAIHNRAEREGETVGSSVSRRIYQPVIERSQQARLDRILASPEFGELTALSKQYGSGQEPRPHTATHFLAPERTMLALEAREPQKYRSWRQWTGFNPETGYSGVQLRDSSHAFLTPDGPRGGGGGSAITVNASPRDRATAALVAQRQPTERDLASDALLAEVVGGGGLDRDRSQTAALGRGDVASDAPDPGVGALVGGGIADAVRARRQGIVNTIQRQQDPSIPLPPPVAPVSPTVVPDPVASGPDQRLAQAQIPPGIRPDTALAPGWPAPPRPAPTNQGIVPAPDMPPSREPIPPASVETMPDPGAPPQRPQVLGPSQAQAYWARYMNNPNVSDEVRAHATRMYNAEETYRKELGTRQENEYINARERWEKATIDKQKHDREAPARAIEQQVKRLTIEEAQHKASLRPAEAEKARVDLEKAKADLEEALFKQGIPRGQAIEEANLRIANARRQLQKPDSFTSAGTTYERPYDAGGQPSGPYAVPPGAPKPTENLTETQAKATTFIVRTKPDLDRVDTEMAGGKALTSMKDAAIDALGPMNSGNMLISDDYRRARDSLGNWGAAFLTHVSGAAVSPSEALRNLPAFIPRPGDNDRDVAEKAERRRNMMDAIATGASDVGMKKIHEANDAYEYRKNGERPPVPVKTLEEAQGLPPGTRIIDPEGKPRRIPARSR